MSRSKLSLFARTVRILRVVMFFKGAGHVVNKNGEVIKTAIKPGTRVHVYYVNMGDSRVVDHVVVE